MAASTITLSFVAAVGTIAFASQTNAPSLALLQLQASYEHKEVRPTHNCGGCGFVGDLRCEQEFKIDYLHAINNCLWPTYDVVFASRHHSGLRCFITDESVAPLLQPLVSDMETRMISADAPCIESLPNTSDVKKSAFAGGINHETELDAEQKERLGKHREAMGRDAASIGKSPINQPYVVLILRNNHRVLNNESVQLLTDALMELGERRHFTVVPYVTGDKDANTINLFAHASGVVGYYGAALANVLFASKPACVVEMTTFKDLDYSSKNYAPITNLNSKHYDVSHDPTPAWKKWAVYGVPLQQLVEANHAEQSIRSHSKDGFVSEQYLVDEMPIVNLTRLDVGIVTDKLDACL